MQSMGLPDSDECFEALLSAYSKHNRHYHSTVHIDAMLRHFDETADLAEYPHETELAIWFHDAIYKPLSSTNEKNSADWAKEFLDSNNYPASGSERVYKLIMATQHNGEAKAHDEKLIVDIDLTVLGTPEHVYDQFELNVRKEYWLVPSFLYRKKRIQLLQGFLNQGIIYNLEFFKNKYEQKARDNITRTVSLL